MTARHSASAWTRRVNFVLALLTGSTVGEAAALVGVRRDTASKWLAEPRVTAFLDSERERLSAGTRDAVAALHRRAVSILLRDLTTSASPERALSVLRMTLPALTRGTPADATELVDEVSAGSYDDVIDDALAELFGGDRVGQE